MNPVRYPPPKHLSLHSHKEVEPKCLAEEFRAQAVFYDRVEHATRYGIAGFGAATALCYTFRVVHFTIGISHLFIFEKTKENFKIADMHLMVSAIFRVPARVSLLAAVGFYTTNYFSGYKEMVALDNAYNAECTERCIKKT